MNQPAPILNGFDIYEAYFTRVYGPNWRNTRQGRPLTDEHGNCNCMYCRMTPADVEKWKRQHGMKAEVQE